MSVLRWLRSFSIPVVTIIVLAFCSDVVAQTSYKVTDLGADRPQRATGRESQTHVRNRLQTRGETIRTPCEHRPRQPALANVADRPISPRCTPAESLGPECSPDFTPANRFRSPRKPSVVCNLPFSSRSGPIPSVRARSAASNTVRFCL